MKKVIVLLCLILALCPLVHAQSALLTDRADLLSSWEAEDLQEQLEQIREQTGLSVVVVTVEGLDGKSVRAYAEDWFDYGGYGVDGILLLVDMDSRQWYISTTGYGMEAVSDARVDYIGDRVASCLRDEDYYDAFSTFAGDCLDHILQAQAGTPYEGYDADPLSWLKTLGICLVIGFVISLIVVLCLKGQLKSVRAKPDAQSYVVSGSMQVTQSHDMYLYSNTVRTAKPKNNSSGGSSGRSHGGGGGRF